MPATSAAISAGTGILQTGMGLVQQIMADRMRKKAMAEYKAHPFQTPESVTRSVSLAGKNAQGSRLAGQDVLESGIQGRTAETINAARKASSSPSQILASTVAAYGQQQQQQQQLDLAAAQDFQRRQNIYQNTLLSLAPYEVKKWEYNILYPIQASLNAASGLAGAGMQNIGQGIQSTTTAFANQQYLKGLNTNPTNGMASISPLQPKTPQLGSGFKQGLMPMQTPVVNQYMNTDEYQDIYG